MYEAANVSLTVTSQIKDFPLFHGIKVMPSGLFPSLLDIPVGCTIFGIPADENAWEQMLLKSLCLGIHPLIMLQLIATSADKFKLFISFHKILTILCRPILLRIPALHYYNLLRPCGKYSNNVMCVY